MPVHATSSKKPCVQLCILTLALGELSRIWRIKPTMHHLSRACRCPSLSYFKLLRLAANHKSKLHPNWSSLVRGRFHPILGRSLSGVR